MKRVEKSLTHEQRHPTTLYLHELRQIYEILCNTMAKVSIRSDEFEYESFDEFLEQSPSDSPSEVDSIASHSDFSHVFVFISSLQVITRLSKNTVAYLGVLEQIKSVLERSKLNSLWIRLLYRRTLGVVLSAIVVAVAVLSAVWSSLRHPVVLGVEFVVLFFVWAQIFYLRNQPLIRIRLIERKEEEPSFIQKHKDAILVAVITAILTLLITRVFNLLTQTGSP